MLKKTELIKNNRQAISNYCDELDKIIKKTKYLPLSSITEAGKCLLELHDYIKYLDPTKEDVIEKINLVYPALLQISTELNYLIEIESDTVESLKDIVRKYL